MFDKGGFKAKQLLVRADLPRGLQYQREENIYHFQLAYSQHFESETSLQSFYAFVFGMSLNSLVKYLVHRVGLLLKCSFQLQYIIL